jgi:hypothetical protein
VIVEPDTTLSEVMQNNFFTEQSAFFSDAKKEENFQFGSLELKAFIN